MHLNTPRGFCWSFSCPSWSWLCGTEAELLTPSWQLLELSLHGLLHSKVVLHCGMIRWGDFNTTSNLNQLYSCKDQGERLEGKDWTYREQTEMSFEGIHPGLWAGLSKAMWWCGLGLSLIQHACRLLHAEVFSTLLIISRYRFPLSPVHCLCFMWPCN